MKGMSFVWGVMLLSLLISCASKPPQFSAETPNNDKLLLQTRLSQLEREKMELELRNSILTKALSERKQKVVNLPHGQGVQPFPRFEELIFDQAKSAYKAKDEERLTEAVRILKSNQPSSKQLEVMYFWLAQLQQDKANYTQALVTYNDFLKNYPSSPYAAQVTYLKAVIYEKLNLKDQALKIYQEVRQKYPHSREKHFADSKLQAQLEKKPQAIPKASKNAPLKQQSLKKE